MIFDIILIVLLIGIWLSIRELPIILSSSVSSGVIRPRYIPVIIIIAFLPAFLFSTDIVGNFSQAADLGNPLTILLISLAASSAVWIFSFFTGWTSIVYSLFGALAALRFYTGDTGSYTYFWQSAVVWIVSPLISFSVTILLFHAIKYAFDKAGFHLILLNRILRIMLVASLVLTLFSFSLNNGSMILAMTRSINILLKINLGGITLYGEFLAWVAFMILVVVLYFRPVKNMATKLSVKLFDINTETSVVIMVSMSLVMLLFSSNTICSAVGLAATPISPIHIALGAIIGIGWMHKNINVDKRELLKSGISVIALPALSFLITYILLRIINVQGNLGNFDAGFSKEQKSLDITTFAIASVLFLLAAIIIYFYISRTRESERARLKTAEDRSQLNEMQKALVDLEIKVIQSENGNLHKRLEIKRKDLINNALWIGQQRDFLDELYNNIHELKKIEGIEEIKNQIMAIEGKIMDKRAFSHEMNELYSQVEVLHKDYSVILHERFPDLTEQERRLATLLRLGFSTKELASIMSITPKSVEVCRYRLRKRLNLKRDENLIQFIKSL